MSTPLKYRMVLCESEDDQSENGRLEYLEHIERVHPAAPQHSLSAHLAAHLAKEKISFHTPGHKGRLRHTGADTYNEQIWRYDLTELPGLDDLANPSEALLHLENRLAELFGAAGSLISVNGASAGVAATMLCLAKRGSRVLIPRNCHRSLVNGLVLSGLSPVWYEPSWETKWGIWGAVELASLKTAIEQESADLAAVWIVSPTYAGDISAIEEISELCHQFGLPLVVDEAHGAPLLTKQTAHLSALTNGADIVIHSFHKHLSALTQTGAIHIGANGAVQFGFNPAELRTCLNLIQTTSPSYLLLKSIDEMAAALEEGSALSALEDVITLSLDLQQALSGHADVVLYEPQSQRSPFHFLFRLGNRSISDMQQAMHDAGIFTEALLDGGILLMLGIGSTEADAAALRQFLGTVAAEGQAQNIEPATIENFAKNFAKPKPINQVLAPRQAFFAPVVTVPKEKAIGMVAAECLAPCPPGWPIVVPGQIIGEEDVKNLNLQSQHSFDFLRVVAPPIVSTPE